MILAFYGPDTYRSRKKMEELVGEFHAKHGTVLERGRIDADEEPYALVTSWIESQSLFSAKKIMTVYYAFSGKNAETMPSKDVRERISESKDALLILWDGVLAAAAKKRFGQWEKYCAKSQEFKTLAGAELGRWINGEAAKQSIVLSRNDMEHLMSLEEDSWAIRNELDKIAVAPVHEAFDITGKSRTVFELGDAMLQNPARAVHVLYELMAQGEEEFGLFTYLSNYMRTLVTVKAYQDRHMLPDPSHGINPYVVKKAGSAVKNIPFNRLRDTLRQFFEADVAIKTGLSTPREAMVRILMN